jgi:plasmid stabilization system protein ParE
MAEAAEWYDDRVAGLGERFLLEAEAAFARIDEKPLTGPPWKHRRLPEGVRRMFVRSFPYSAVYILEPRIVVVALVHARRRPGYWVKRLSEV